MNLKIICLLIANIPTIITYAQLKVVTNLTTIHSNSNVQVQSTVGNQFTITRDSSWAGIGTLILYFVEK